MSQGAKPHLFKGRARKKQNVVRGKTALVRNYRDESEEGEERLGGVGFLNLRGSKKSFSVLKGLGCG